MYFNPLLMLPFSTIETIREEKNEIVDMAAIEKYLKVSGFITTSVTLKGKAPARPVAADNLDTKFRITIKRWKDNENNKGAITITIVAMKIM
jgi:hypothetical protein